MKRDQLEMIAKQIYDKAENQEATFKEVMEMLSSSALESFILRHEKVV